MTKRCVWPLLAACGLILGACGGGPVASQSTGTTTSSIANRTPSYDSALLAVESADLASAAAVALRISAAADNAGTLMTDVETGYSASAVAITAAITSMDGVCERDGFASAACRSAAANAGSSATGLTGTSQASLVAQLEHDASAESLGFVAIGNDFSAADTALSSVKFPAVARTDAERLTNDLSRASTIAPVLAGLVGGTAEAVVLGEFEGYAKAAGTELRALHMALGLSPPKVL